MRAFPQRVFRVIGSVILLFATISGPASATDNLDQKVAQAADELAKVSAIAAQAAKDLKATQAKLPAARAALGGQIIEFEFLHPQPIGRPGRHLGHARCDHPALLPVSEGAGRIR